MASPAGRRAAPRPTAPQGPRRGPSCPKGAANEVSAGAPLLSPGLLLLPPPLAARPCLLHAEVELLDVVLLAQPRAGVFHDDAAVLEHIAVVGDVEGHV